MYRTAFPDLTSKIDGQIAEGDVVVSHGMTAGTHQGPLGEIPATGRSISIAWILVSRFDGDRISSEFEVYDALGMMQQLGVVPAPA
jgi:predicted ester cyclase